MSVSKDTPGIKFDGDKLRYDLLPPDSIEEVVKVLTYGAKKYDDWNWAKGMSYVRVFAAIMRHLWAWRKGETIDPESGLSHLSHAACGVFFLIHYEKNAHIYGEIDPFDDRDDAYIIATADAARRQREWSGKAPSKDPLPLEASGEVQASTEISSHLGA